MSKKIQVYYHIVCGALGGLLGWLVVGQFATGDWNIWLSCAFIGSGVGLFIGAAAGAVEGAVITQTARRVIEKTILGSIAGVFSGAVGLMLGEIAFLVSGGEWLGRILGWTLLGLLLGIGEGLVNRNPKRAAYGIVGGTLAGIIGGAVYELLTQLFLQRSDTAQMVASALGLIAIGAALGGIIPLTIIAISKGTILVRTGRREGLEISILDGATLGSYDGCEVYLPGDPMIQPEHAQIYRQGEQFIIRDLGYGGMLVNNQPVAPQQEYPLASNSEIRIGGTVMEFK